MFQNYPQSDDITAGRRNETEKRGERERDRERERERERETPVREIERHNL